MLEMSTQMLCLQCQLRPEVAVPTVADHFYGVRSWSACSGQSKWLKWWVLLQEDSGLLMCPFFLDLPALEAGGDCQPDATIWMGFPGAQMAHLIAALGCHSKQHYSLPNPVISMNKESFISRIRRI